MDRMRRAAQRAGSLPSQSCESASASLWPGHELNREAIKNEAFAEASKFHRVEFPAIKSYLAPT